MYISREIVGPERAEELLSKNSKNRSLNERTVRIMVDQLRKGLWKETHQGIAVGQSGALLDGQHRLTAIARSGIAVPLLVATGVPDSCIDVLDTGRKRGPSDAFAIYGVPDPIVTSSGTRIYDNYYRLPDRVWSGLCAYELSSAELFEVYQQRVENRAEFARRIKSRCYKQFRYLTPSVLFASTLLFQDAGYEEEQISIFFDRLSRGYDLKPGSPIGAYRSQVLNNGYAGRSIIKQNTAWQQRLLSHIIKLWNSELNGQRVSVFKESSIPPMPQIMPAQKQLTA